MHLNDTELIMGRGIKLITYSMAATREFVLCILHEDSGITHSISVGELMLMQEKGDGLQRIKNTLIEIAAGWVEILDMEIHEIVESLPLLRDSAKKMAMYRIENGI